jgi:hypothetical protein
MRHVGVRGRLAISPPGVAASGTLKIGVVVVAAAGDPTVDVRLN